MARKSIADYIQQGYLVKKADDDAIAAHYDWTLPHSLRVQHDAAHQALIKSEADAQAKKNIYHDTVSRKDDAETDAYSARLDLIAYIVASYEKAEADSMLQLIELDTELPEDDQDAVSMLFETIHDWVRFDGTPQQIPDEYKNPFSAATDEFASLVIETSNARSLKNEAFDVRDMAVQRYTATTKRILRWLARKLPEGIYDERLGLYGFNPRERPSYGVPADITLSAYIKPAAPLVELTASDDPNGDTTTREFQRGDAPQPNEDVVFITLGEVSGLVWTDTSVEFGKSYVYRARGKNRWHTGNGSNEVMVDLPDKE